LLTRSAGNAEQSDTAVNRADPLDWQDIRASLRGDGAAYARLVGRYQQAIAAYLWRFSRDRGRCEELVHDVFVEAYLGLRNFRGDAPLLHWLRKIATRVGYRYWQERTRRQAEASASIQAWDRAALAEPDALDAAEAAAALHALLRQMSARDRLVLTLMYLQGCSVAEIAQLSGWSATMVKVQAHRARQRLKKLLAQAENEP
jgi:RNA polymerase sigma-70 factor (ECF subfamily)